MTKNAHRDDIYLKRELVTRSFEGRPMEMLTITGDNEKLGEREEMIEGLFPDSEPSKRPYKFGKKRYIYLSARVHPGEVAASHMLNGFMGHILSDPSKDIRVALALHHFVFVIIPMLNPDGVYRGHYRTDTHGQNLNRSYIDPCKVIMPTIWAADQIINSMRLLTS
jgi:murein tripeptide amidase MpaA